MFHFDKGNTLILLQMAIKYLTFRDSFFQAEGAKASIKFEVIIMKLTAKNYSAKSSKPTT